MSSPPSTTRLTRFDGLRALAVLAVVEHHFGIKAINDVLAPGGAGVQIFFVLSGFLITGILLEGRQRAARGHALATFYVRRALRIFPAYYVTLTVAAVLNASVYTAWPWHAAYLSNVKMALDRRWLGPVSHFWSLSVEEQFYLVWPLIVLFVRASWIPRLLWALVMSAPAWRFLLLHFSGPFAAETSLPGSIDALSIGAWLAWRQRHGSAPISVLFGLVGFGGVATAIVTTLFEAPSTVALVFERTFSALLFAWIIDRVYHRRRGTAWLEWSPLVAIGNISYGIYLFHNLVPSITRTIAPGVADWMWRGGIAAFVSVTALSIGLATLSWWVIEKPMNGLKRYWSYEGNPERSRPASRQLASCAVEA